MGKIKGLALIPAVKALRHLRVTNQEPIDPAVRPYLTDRVFPSQWYPEEDLLVLLDSLVRLLPERPDVWEWIGAMGAEADFTDTYSAFIRKGRPDLVLERYPRIWRLYHDNGTVSVDCGEECCTVEIDSILTRESTFCRLQAGHFACILELTGARSVHVELEHPGTEGRAARWQCTWQSS